MKIRNQLIMVLGLRILVIWGMLFFTHSMFPNWVFAQNQVTSEILARITQLGEATDSFHADVTSIIEGRSGEIYRTKGKFKFKWPRMRWEKHWSVVDGKPFGISVSNGKIKWTYSPNTKIARKYKLKALDEDAQQKGWLSAAALDAASLEYLGKKEFEGEEVYVIEGKPSALIKHKNPDPPGVSRFYIGTTDGIMRKLILYNQEGREIGSQTFSSIRIDPSISEKDFEFIPPEGTKVHEVKDVGPRTNPDQ